MTPTHLPLRAVVLLMAMRCEFVDGPLKATEKAMDGRTPEDWRLVNEEMARNSAEYKNEMRLFLTCIKEGRHAELGL